MKILVINAGSSSLKYQLIDMQDESVLAKGNCERIGIDGKFTHKTADGKVIKRDVAMPDHTAAFNIVKDALLSGEGGRLRFARRCLGAVAADWETPRLSRTCPAEFDSEIEVFG